MTHPLLKPSGVHPSWLPVLEKALSVVDSDYLKGLLGDDEWLPGMGYVFAAFSQNINNLRYVLFGESPYPRKKSSVGVAFLDGMVTDLWSSTGLSKEVNKATSLRNMIKTMLVADGYLEPKGVSQDAISQINKTELVTTIQELFNNLESEGFLLLNATPVLHPKRKPNKESKFWYDFNNVLLQEILKIKVDNSPQLILWGSIAKTITSYEVSQSYRIIKTEHPYNISFINNASSLKLFAQVSPLKKR